MPRLVPHRRGAELGRRLGELLGGLPGAGVVLVGPGQDRLGDPPGEARGPLGLAGSRSAGAGPRTAARRDRRRTPRTRRAPRARPRPALGPTGRSPRPGRRHAGCATGRRGRPAARRDCRSGRDHRTATAPCACSSLFSLSWAAVAIADGSGAGGGSFPVYSRPEEAADLLLELRDHRTVFRDLRGPLGADLKAAIALAREVVLFAKGAKAFVAERQPEDIAPAGRESAPPPGRAVRAWRLCGLIGPPSQNLAEGGAVLGADSDSTSRFATRRRVWYGTERHLRSRGRSQPKERGGHGRGRAEPRAGQDPGCAGPRARFRGLRRVRAEPQLPPACGRGNPRGTRRAHQGLQYRHHGLRARRPLRPPTQLDRPHRGGPPPPVAGALLSDQRPRRSGQDRRPEGILRPHLRGVRDRACRPRGAGDPHGAGARAPRRRLRRGRRRSRLPGLHPRLRPGARHRTDALQRPAGLRCRDRLRLPGASGHALRPEPGIDYILTGGTTVGPDHFEVDVMLVEAHTGRSIWGDSLQRSLQPVGDHRRPQRGRQPGRPHPRPALRHHLQRPRPRRRGRAAREPRQLWLHAALLPVLADLRPGPAGARPRVPRAHHPRRAGIFRGLRLPVAGLFECPALRAPARGRR